jgi:hypothetical protein
MRAGLTAEEVARRFEGDRWQVLSAERLSDADLRAVNRRGAPSFEAWRYRLRRLPS